jgi:flagellar L-ring protein precursor FlgH
MGKIQPPGIEGRLNTKERRIMFGRIALVLITGALVTLTGCIEDAFLDKSREPLTRPEPSQRVAQVQPQPRDHVVQSGLWRPASHRGLFQDLRAQQVGDLVTVNIVETAKADKKATTKTERESSISAGISNLMGWETKLGKIGVPAAFDNQNMIKSNLTNAFDGSGQTTRNETMTASITARVMEVLPNGTLFIRGARKIKVNSESQYITLSGLVRPQDISPDNTVLSSYIAEARIEYTGSGAVSDKQRPGWLMRAVDYVWPF